MQNPSDRTPQTVRGWADAQGLAQLIDLNPCHLARQPILAVLRIDANIPCAMIRLSVLKMATLTNLSWRQLALASALSGEALPHAYLGQRDSKRCLMPHACLPAAQRCKLLTCVPALRACCATVPDEYKSGGCHMLHVIWA